MAGRTKQLFPTRIFEGSVANSRSLNGRLKKDMLALSREDRMGQKWSAENYRGGYTSYASLTDLHRRAPSFMELEKLLEKDVRAFAKENHWEMQGLELEMTACWMNIMPKNTYHSLHLHPHSVLSGAYYVDVPKGSVCLKLEDPRMNQFMNAPVGEPLYHQIAPKAGNFVIFESWLRHEVPPNQSETPRLSLSFNYALVDAE